MKKSKTIMLTILYAALIVTIFTGCSTQTETTPEPEASISDAEITTTETLSEDMDTSAGETETFSMKIDDAYHDSVGAYITGTVETGTIRVNDRVEIIKEGSPILGTVLKIEILGEEVQQACAGDKNVGLTVDNIRQSDVVEDAYITTPRKESLEAEQALMDSYASVLHAPRTDDDDYEINITNGEYIETIFCTIDNIEFVVDYEFGTNNIHVESPRYSDSRLAGFKASLTNTSDVAYYPCNASPTTWSYNKSSYTPGGPYDGKLYVEKDGELLENAEVAPGETVTIYVLGEMDYSWHERYADTMYVYLYMREYFKNEDNADSHTPEYSFYVRDFNK